MNGENHRQQERTENHIPAEEKDEYQAGAHQGENQGSTPTPQLQGIRTKFQPQQQQLRHHYFGLWTLVSRMLKSEDVASQQLDAIQLLVPHNHESNASF